jgi:tyrosyl-tRNA synthetase
VVTGIAEATGTSTVTGVGASIRAGTASAAGGGTATAVESSIAAALPVVEVSKMQLEAGLPAFELFRRAGLASSGSDARRLIKGGGARLNDETVAEEMRLVTIADIDAKGLIKLSAGKKRHALVRAV